MNKCKKVFALSLSTLLLLTSFIPVAAVESVEETSQTPPPDYSDVYVETSEENSEELTPNVTNEIYELEITTEEGANALETVPEDEIEVTAEETINDLTLPELETRIINAIKNYSSSVDVSSLNVKFDLANGKHILSDFQDDLFYKYPEDSFYVQNLTFKQENGKLLSVKINYIDSFSKINQMKTELSNRISSIVSQVSGITDETEKIGKVSELIWSSYYDDFSSVDIHTHDAYGCLVRGYASCYGAAIAFNACMNRLGYEGGYYVSGADIYSKNKIGDTWKYTNIAWNQSRKNNTYLLTDVKESTRTYLKEALTESEYTPMSLFSDEPSMSEKSLNGQYFNEQIMLGNTSFTLPENIYFNYRRGTSDYITRIKHEYPESGILVKSISSNTKNDKFNVTNVNYYEQDPTERTEMLQKYYTERNKIIQRAKTFSTDEQKIIFVNNYITKTTAYKEYVDGVKLVHSHDAYGCLVNGECVCEGYSTAFHDIMKYLGINDTYVQSYNHIWNKVLLNGQYKIIDVTNNYDNKYLLSNTHEANVQNGSLELSRYTYVFNPTLSMKSSATKYLIQQLTQTKTHIDTSNINFWLDIRAKKFDTTWYVDTLRNIYPIEMRDVDTMTFTTSGDNITAVDVTYKQRSADDIQKFEAIINNIVSIASTKTTEPEKVATAMTEFIRAGIKGSLSGEEDMFMCGVTKSGSYLAKARVFCYVLEKMGIRYSVIKDRNVYYYVKNVYDGVVRYSSPCLGSKYINLEEIVSYKEFNNYPVYDFLSTEGENAYIDGGNASAPELFLIENAVITGLKDKTYTGNPVTQSLTIKYGSTTLIENKDYTLTYRNNTSVGIATVIVTGVGNYVGTLDYTFAINKASISNFTIDGVEESYTYTGSAITPAITVKNGTKLLKDGEDYTVSYKNNVDIGTATITISGIGNYTGTKSVTFQIAKKEYKFQISGLAPSYQYTGKEIRPAFTIYCEGKRLTQNVDYTITYIDNINAGTTTVRIVGLNEYEVEYNLTFRITAKPLSEATTITIPQATYIYTGSQIAPVATVKDEDTTLQLNKDYSVSYTNNTEEGTATLTINGMGNYSGTKSINFQITKPQAASEFVISGISSSYTYTGSEIKPLPRITCNGLLLKINKDYIITYSNNINAGTASLTVKGINGYNYEQTQTYTIVPKSITTSNVTLPQSNYDYTGKEVKPVPIVKVGTKILVEGVDYTYSYLTNTNPGTAYILVNAKGNYKGTAKKSFTINKISIADYKVTGIDASYLYQAKSIVPAPQVSDGTKILTKGTDYTIACSNNVNVGTATLTITGKGMYTGTITRQFMIARAPISSVTISGITTSYAYTGQPVTPAPVVKLGTKTLVAGTDYTVSYSNNIEVGTATVTITGINNMYGTTAKTFKVASIPVSQCKINGINSSYAFTGDYIKPVPVITFESKTLIEGTDYTLSYSSNKNAGTAKITIKGIGKFTGSTTKTFTINPIPLQNITINNLLESYTYTGSAIKPSISVIQNGRTLTRTTDYTVTYEDNINAGQAQIIITGGKNYTGQIIKTFTIVPKNVSGLTLSTSTTDTFSYGSLTFPLLTIKHSTKILKEGTDYSISYTLNQTKLTVTITGKGNYTGIRSKILTAK